MNIPETIETFLSRYDAQVSSNAHLLRELVLQNLPQVQEQLDVSAKMIGYCYGQKYSELICMLIPSQKGLKLGFYKGVDLPDPHHLLKGNGKISRYVEIKTVEDIEKAALQTMLAEALKTYHNRNIQS
ncbi:protein of unknown function (DU1801) [Flexibacter flexilis DSM 6793]|uniref:YdhG-like domain-containing protein n=1 Tax=Flexibacter flexilis DSM 6793 TaxID=927664 RepID=A0A1I1HLE0_9BACT|nr:DUF1801 domain-containing protein [Flexibacter flexilis]SFC24646.1 protein of unknown function (DU1801) [Flexibacter flexilis DSM 6793]